jgi:hypothetical protein
LSLTIILSGPKSSVNQARTALAAARFDVQPGDHDHGLTPTITGEEIREVQAFIEAHGEDINKAHTAVEPLGWTLRMHYDTPEPTQVDKLTATLAEMRAELDALKGG